MMALTSVVAAALMQGQSPELSRRRGRRRRAASACCSAPSTAPGRRHPGARHHRHARDVVRLGRLRAARPQRAGRRAPPTGSRSSSSGSLGTEWIPKAAGPADRRSSPSSGSRSDARALGLSMYAIGSNRLAAFRSGVAGQPDEDPRLRAHRPVRRARRAGLSTTSTGIGTPVPGAYTLISVAAVVLGGVSLAGGRGGVLGPDRRRLHPRS